MSPFGTFGTSEQSQAAEVPWRAGIYLFFGRPVRFRKTEIPFSCRLFGDVVGSSTRGTKCRYRGKKRLPWRREPRIPPALPLSAVSTSIVEKLEVIHSSERDKEERLFFFSVVLTRGFFFFYLFIYICGRSVQDEIEKQCLEEIFFLYILSTVLIIC
ncbi:hypothetical protein CEXT_171771 [Caerostris extrusa]|uniref:Uncharacterized protein n=1 Tax=Caerostris extrusa TaxID=172846 RepID=A0AAV4V4M1_CAEEX|nr:hypothetical protein CEXT_171771 [Caerostris extrusa]